MSIAVVNLEQDAEVVGNQEQESANVTPEMQAETELTAEVVRLWCRHRKMAIAEKKTLVELQAIREELGRKLAEIKRVVCRLGRASEWGWFLRQQAIPKATADRLVKKYGQTGEEVGNVLNEEVVAENEVQKFSASVLKKGNRLLPHQYDKYCFIVRLAEDFGVLDEDGCLIEEPEEPEDEMEPHDDEPGDDLFMPSGDCSDEVLAMVNDEEPTIDGADDNPLTGLGEQKRQIEL